jgi:hypothetical protein
MRKYVLMTLAMLLFASAAAGFVSFAHNPIIGSYGCIACMAPLGLVRIAKGQPRLNILKRPAAAPPGRLMWAIGVALGLLLIASYLCLREDELHGCTVVWPVYLFAVMCIGCALFWGYLVAATI